MDKTEGLRECPFEEVLEKEKPGIYLCPCNCKTGDTVKLVTRSC